MTNRANQAATGGTIIEIELDYDAIKRNCAEQRKRQAALDALLRCTGRDQLVTIADEAEAEAEYQEHLNDVRTNR